MRREACEVAGPGRSAVPGSRQSIPLVRWRSPRALEKASVRCEVRFLWFDMWIGAYWDRVGRMLYVCPLPCIVFKFWRRLP